MRLDPKQVSKLLRDGQKNLLALAKSKSGAKEFDKDRSLSVVEENGDILIHLCLRRKAKK